MFSPNPTGLSVLLALTLVPAAPNAAVTVKSTNSWNSEVETLEFKARPRRVENAVVGPDIEVTKAVEYVFDPAIPPIVRFDHNLARLSDGRSLFFMRSPVDPREVGAVLVTEQAEETATVQRKLNRSPPPYVPRIPGYQHVDSAKLMGDAWLGLWRPTEVRAKPILVLFNGSEERCELGDEWVIIANLSSLPFGISAPVTAHGKVWNLSDVRPTAEGIVIVEYDWTTAPEFGRIAYPCPPKFKLEPIEYPLGNPPRLPPPPPDKRD